MNDAYIDTLSYDEKLVFVKLFCRLIKADGVIDNSELEFLNTVSARYGIDKNTVIDIIKSINNVNYVAEARKIVNRVHALELIKELCVLANVDESLDNAELDIIINAAEAMGVEDEKVILINRWVLDSLILNKAGRIIMEKDNG